MTKQKLLDELEARHNQIAKALIAETALRALLTFVMADEKNVVTLSQDFDLGVTVAMPDGHYHIPSEPRATVDAVIAGLATLLSEKEELRRVSHEADKKAADLRELLKLSKILLGEEEK